MHLKLPSWSSVSQLLTCRVILLILTTTAFIINAMLLSTMNIAIISISADKNVNWSESQKQNMLGILYIGYAFGKIPAGRLSELIGSKKVIGISTILAGFITIGTVSIVKWNYYVLLVARIVLGFLLAALFPAQLTLGAKWFSPSSQTAFMACLQATSLGIAITFFISGFLISSFGWSTLFYATGTLAVLWSVCWFYFIYDSPEQHPRISPEERFKITNELGSSKTSSKKTLRIPLKRILTSAPFWAIVAAQLACYFQTIIFQTELPSYIQDVLKLEDVNTGIYSSVPQIGLYLAALMFGYLGTSLLQSNRFSKKNIRRCFETLGLLVPILFLLLQSFIGKTLTLTIIFFSFTLAFSAACTCGHYPNMIDIAPNYAGTIGGLVYTVSALSGYAATNLTGFLLKDGNGFDDWRYLFWILAALNLVGGVVYLMFCSTDIQDWNNEELINNEKKNISA